MRYGSAPMVAAAAFGLAAPALAQHEHHELLEIGRTDADVLEFHTHAMLPIPVPVSTFPEFPGFATAEVAFESLAAPNSHGQLPLLAGSDIRVIVLAADPGLTLFDGLTPVPIGGEVVLGAPFFHYLPVWSIAPGSPPGEYTVTLMARDAAGLQADSAPFQVSFTPVPEPAVGLAVVGGLLLRRRRR